MSLTKEFRDFAVKGNVIDLAVGVIIGGAFGKIVSSLVSDIVMPLMGTLTGKVSFSDFYVPLSSKVPWGATLTAAQALGPILPVGKFLDASVQFLILAFVIFLMVRAINRFRKHEEPPVTSAAPPEDVQLLMEIRDLLREKSPMNSEK